MPDPSDPLDRLSALGGGDPLPLAPADAVRARGEQRRRNGRTALGVTGAAVLLAAGAAFGLGGAGETPDSLGPATQSPTATPSDPAPPPQPSESGFDQRPTEATSVPANALLRPEDVTAARPGSWTSSELTPGPLLDPCGGTAYPLDAKRQDVAYRALTHSDGQRLRQLVALYDSESSAAAALLGFRKAVVGCPSRALSVPRAEPAYQRIHQLATEPGIQRFGDEALFVDAGTGCSIDQDCDQEAVRYAVVRTQRVLTVVELSSTERGDVGTADLHSLAEQLAESAHLAVLRYGCAVFDTCDGSAYSRSDFPRPAVLTHGGDAWAVYLAVSERDGTADLAAAESAASEIGYGSTLSGPYSCDVGAKEGLGYPEEAELFVAVLYFDSAATAQRFVDAYDGPVVKTVKVQTLCLD